MCVCAESIFVSKAGYLDNYVMDLHKIYSRHPLHTALEMVNVWCMWLSRWLTTKGPKFAIFVWVISQVASSSESYYSDSWQWRLISTSLSAPLVSVIILAHVAFIERIIALSPWCSFICLSGMGVHCDHTVHFSADLSLRLDSPMFWAPWQQKHVHLLIAVFFQFHLEKRWGT